jgi:hypothetical protein
VHDARGSELDLVAAERTVAVEARKRSAAEVAQMVSQLGAGTAADSARSLVPLVAGWGLGLKGMGYASVTSENAAAVKGCVSEGHSKNQVQRCGDVRSKVEHLFLEQELGCQCEL